jgi:AcrR family transcriptional regulator
VVDGRRARRERGRLAVTEAVIDLVFEGHVPPTTEQLAQRAGVSEASLFCYFETLDDLRDQATQRYFERYAHLFEVPRIGVGALDERIKAFVAARVDQHETTSPMARMMRARALEVSHFDATLHHLRAMQSDQIRLHFEPEMAGHTPATRDDLVATVAALTSFESWNLFRGDHQRTNAQIRRAWSMTLDRVLRTP